MTAMKNMQHLFTSSEIPLLILVVLAGPLLASSPGPHLNETYFDHLPLDDVLFTEDVLMEVSARSRIECSQKCMETEGCVICTFHSSPQGPPGHCRLHSQLQTATDGKQSMPGARSMARRRPRDGGYVPACDRRLKVVKKWPGVKYTTARQNCTDMQGHLVMAKSSAELQCIRSFANNNTRHRYPGVVQQRTDVQDLGNIRAEEEEDEPRNEKRS
ncbi:hypothetical protein ACOMHN_055931 [Nucella lapillus]